MIDINIDAFNESILILKELKNAGSLSKDKVDKYLDTVGIDFLKRHLKICGGFEFTKEVFEKFVKKLVENPDILENDSTMIKSFKRGYKYVESFEKELDTVDIKDVAMQAIDLMNKYLPCKSELESEVYIYFLYGIRGTAIIYGNEIGVDMCSEEIMHNGKINKEGLTNLLAHELHHIYFETFAKNIDEKIIDKKSNVFYETIKGIFSEGLCSYYITDPFTTETSYKYIWNNNLENINELFYDVEKTLIKFSEEKNSDEKEGWYLFDENLIGYTIGYVMVKTIDEVMGKEKVMECIKDYRNFINYYNDAVKKGNIKLPIINVEI